MLLACFAVDYRVLFEPLTEEIVQDGFQYYKTFYNAPLGIKVRKMHLACTKTLRNAFYLFEKQNKLCVYDARRVDRRYFMAS